MIVYVNSAITVALSYVTLVVAGALLSIEEFAIFSVFVLVNSLVMLGDIGVTASIFKHLSKYLAGNQNEKVFVASALFVGKRLKFLALFIIMVYGILLLNEWELGNEGFFIILVYVISANNRWNFAIQKVFLFSDGQTNQFWKIACIFSIFRLIAVCILAQSDFSVLIILAASAIISSIENFYLRSVFRDLLKDIYINKVYLKDIKFDYVLGVSSVLWVCLIQIDKIYFSLLLGQETFAMYALFLQLCMGFFVINSVVYSVYGKDLYGELKAQLYALKHTFRLLGSIFIVSEILLLNPWLYEDLLSNFGITIFHSSVITSYLILMFVQPLVILVINEGGYLKIALSYFCGIAIWLIMANIALNFAWICQSLLIAVMLFFSLRKIHVELRHIVVKSVLTLIFLSLILFAIFMYFASLEMTNYVRFCLLVCSLVLSVMYWVRFDLKN